MMHWAISIEIIFHIYDLTKVGEELAEGLELVLGLVHRDIKLLDTVQGQSLLLDQNPSRVSIDKGQY